MTAPTAEHARQAAAAGPSESPFDFHSAGPFGSDPNEHRANERDDESSGTTAAPIPTTLRSLQILTVLNDLFEADDA